MASPCLSLLAKDGVSISLLDSTLELDQSTLDKLSANLPVRIRSNRHMPQLWRERASALLAIAAQGHDRFGCRTVAIEGVPPGSLYLVGSLIETSQAAVADARSGHLFKEVTVRAGDMGADKPSGALGTFYLAGSDDPFLVLSNGVLDTLTPPPPPERPALTPLLAPELPLQ